MSTETPSYTALADEIKGSDLEVHLARRNTLDALAASAVSRRSARRCATGWRGRSRRCGRGRSCSPRRVRAKRRAAAEPRAHAARHAVVPGRRSLPRARPADGSPQSPVRGRSARRAPRRGARATCGARAGTCGGRRGLVVVRAEALLGVAAVVRLRGGRQSKRGGVGLHECEEGRGDRRRAPRGAARRGGAARQRAPAAAARPTASSDFGAPTSAWPIGLNDLAAARTLTCPTAALKGAQAALIAGRPVSKSNELDALNLLRKMASYRLEGYAGGSAEDDDARLAAGTGSAAWRNGRAHAARREAALRARCARSTGGSAGWPKTASGRCGAAKAERAGGGQYVSVCVRRTTSRRAAISIGISRCKCPGDGRAHARATDVAQPTCCRRSAAQDRFLSCAGHDLGAPGLCRQLLTAVRWQRDDAERRVSSRPVPRSCSTAATARARRCGGRRATASRIASRACCAVVPTRMRRTRAAARR